MGAVETAIGDEYTAAASNASGLGQLVDVSNFGKRSDAVQNAAIEEAVTEAEKDVSNAKDAVAQVDGLAKASSTLSSAQQAYKATLETANDAFAEAAGEVTTGSGKIPASGSDLNGPLKLATAYDSLDELTGAADAAKTAGNSVTLVEDSTGSAKDVVVIDEKGKVKAADGINADDVTNIDALVADLQAAFNAGVAKDNSLNAYNVAANEVLNIESELVFTASDDSVIDGQLVEGLDSDGTTTKQYIEKGAAGSEEYFEISSTSLNSDGNIVLKAAGTKEKTDPTNLSDQDITDVIIDEGVSSNTLVEADGDLTANFKAGADLSTGVVEAEDTLETLNKAIERFENARDLKDGLDGKDEAIKTASDALDEAGFDVVDLDGTTAAATSDDDVFLTVEGQDSAITNFGLQGDDRLYVGNDYTLVELGANESINNRVGDANALEVFYQESAGNLELFVEGQAFAGNATTTEDVTQITLTGVSADDVNFEGGFLSSTAAADIA
ncbi:hypothetical protein GCM10022228_06620 [Halomonas cibimaris]|uniref:Flagellin n=1 Tax=Halomonas cibimaris TaxID=657012 RepID=A0ABP7LGV3_9GAMM